MSKDLIYDFSPKKLIGEIERALDHIDQPLGESARQFLAIARIQSFDGLPKIVSKPEMEARIANGCIELNRGLHGTAEHNPRFYANELGLGKLYPGSHTAHGHGIYFAEPSVVPGLHDTIKEVYPRFSRVAEQYASGQLGGVIVRAALKQPRARTVSLDDLKEMYSGAANRADRAGITDLGTFAAASGIDAFYIDRAFTYSDERMWVVLNRTMLVLQQGHLTYKGARQPLDKSVADI